MAIVGGAIHSTVQWTIFTLLGAFAVDKKFSSFHVFFFISFSESGNGEKRAMCGSKRRANRFLLCAPTCLPPGLPRDGYKFSF